LICLGKLKSGRVLNYDEARYEFYLDNHIILHSDLRALDSQAQILWAAPEQRDWFKKIDAVTLKSCQARALASQNAEGVTSAHDQVLRDAARDDSVLAGKIVDASPVLVEAVASALEARGFAGAGAKATVAAGAGTVPNQAGAPGAEAEVAAAAAVQLPEGMEAAGQLIRQPGRRMTITERYLLRKILKDDDKQKARREKEAQALEGAYAQREELIEEAHTRAGVHVDRAHAQAGVHTDRAHAQAGAHNTRAPGAPSESHKGRAHYKRHLRNFLKRIGKKSQV
jgi:hypothetical protein